MSTKDAPSSGPAMHRYAIPQPHEREPALLTVQTAAGVPNHTVSIGIVSHVGHAMIDLRTTDAAQLIKDLALIAGLPEFVTEETPSTVWNNADFHGALRDIHEGLTPRLPVWEVRDMADTLALSTRTITGEFAAIIRNHYSACMQAGLGCVPTIHVRAAAGALLMCLDDRSRPGEAAS